MKPIIAMRQRWESVLFLHWRVTPSVLERHLSGDVRLDTFDGSAWLSLVPFVSRAMRPAFLPPSFGLDFTEANIRTYVVHRGEPAIWLFSADVASTIAAAGYRPLLGRAARRASVSLTDLNNTVAVRATRGNASLSITAGVEDRASPGDDLDRFLLERYLQVAERGGTMWGVRVHHAPLTPLACSANIEDKSWTDVMDLPPIEPVPERGHYVGGIDVDVEAPRPLTPIRARRFIPLRGATPR